MRDLRLHGERARNQLRRRFRRRRFTCVDHRNPISSAHARADRSVEHDADGPIPVYRRASETDAIGRPVFMRD